jgi:hypothetical protein
MPPGIVIWLFGFSSAIMAMHDGLGGPFLHQAINLGSWQLGKFWKFPCSCFTMAQRTAALL